jgi:putative DNA primase/helicase
LDGITRFTALSKVIGHWVRNTRLGICDRNEAWSAVCDHNAAMIVPPWEDERLLREFEAIERRDAATHRHSGHNGAAALSGADAGHASPPEFSEDALAATFAEKWSQDWRHVALWGTWFQWSGTNWQRDDKGAVREAVRQVCRSAALSAERPNDQRRIASDKTIAAVLRLVAADPVIATLPSDWDCYPMLLNTPANLIDLATGETMVHDRSHLISQVTGAKPGSDCPRWLKFLAEVTDDDPALMGYLARLAGYCLTGKTNEQMFAFIHGPGGNGKSVFVQIIAAVLGDYAATATLDTFMASASARHLTELAGLRAARLVIVPETEAGRSWAEARIKTVTGGEKVRANFMHRDHFEYVPQFKLVVMGNHRPALFQVNEAMHRRMHLVPFDVIIPEDRRDRGLLAALMQEIDGILGWMLEGCANWHRDGLAPPPRMAVEASAYFASEDLIGQWIEAECDCEQNAHATSRLLFVSWTAWATAEGQAVGSSRALGEALRSRGFKSAKIGPRRDRGWMGIGLRHGHLQQEAAE